MAPKADWEKYRKPIDDDEKPEKEVVPLSEGDIEVIKTYGAGPYQRSLKDIDGDITNLLKSINDKVGIAESDTGLAPPSQWDVVADGQSARTEQPLQVARCTKIIQNEEDPDQNSYAIDIKQIAKFIVSLVSRFLPTDIV